MGVNHFLILAALNVGSEGPQTGVDLVSLAAPSGLDSSLTFICAGKFVGDISVEGSPSSSGDNWEVITQFNSGVSANGDPLQSQEIITVNNVIVRRLRANVRGRVLDATVLSVAGQQNCECAINSSASWSGTRYYAVDNENGDDSNLGYSDVSLANAGEVAVKTPEQVAHIIPPLGNPDQVLVVAFKGRTGIYVGPDGVTIANFVKTLIGYGNIVIRSTADFSNDATDERLLAAETVLGPYTVDSGSTTSTIPVVGGGLPTDKTPYAYRIRFTSGALAGTTCHHWENNTSSVITVGTNMSAPPTAGDTFVVEKPSVELGTFLLYVANSSTSPGDFSVAGIECQTRFALHGAGLVCRSSFINVTGSATVSIRGFESVSASNSYLSPAGSLKGTGTGMRVNSSGSVVIENNNRLGTLTHSSFQGAGNFNLYVTQITSVTHGAIYLSKAVKKIVCLGNGNAGSVTTVANDGILGNRGSTTIRPMRIGGTGSTQFQGSFGCWGVVFEDTQFAYWSGTSLGIILNDITGITSAAHPFNFETLYGSTIRCGIEAPNTAAGTQGAAIAVAGSNPVYWADLTKTNVVDVHGNNFIGTALTIVTSSVAVLNASGLTVSVGDVLRGNGTGNQIASAQGDALANAEFLGVALNTVDNNGTLLMSKDGFAVCNFDGPPTPRAIAYLSPGTARSLTTTIPIAAATNQKLRVGRVIGVVSGTLAKVSLSPEILAVTADGLA